MSDIYAVNKRIRILREHLEMGRGAFALDAGLDKRTLENLEHERQKAYVWHIELISKKWPGYGYWLATGETIPEAGQISPELEQIREDSKREGTA